MSYTPIGPFDCRFAFYHQNYYHNPELGRKGLNPTLHNISFETGRDLLVKVPNALSDHRTGYYSDPCLRLRSGDLSQVILVTTPTCLEKMVEDGSCSLALVSFIVNLSTYY